MCVCQQFSFSCTKSFVYIQGVTDPMLYIGMLFSMFAWHVEDHYLYRYTNAELITFDYSLHFNLLNDLMCTV